ncbi:hypothetical protein [Streptosporangium vulgare]|uniref:Uncharacterized protein n=1 Tax=Streptosporangium vulgare TaxID=46190 RepID=A0ABV5TKF8_9ACTN
MTIAQPVPSGGSNGTASAAILALSIRTSRRRPSSASAVSTDR